jgi:ribosome-associated protein
MLTSEQVNLLKKELDYKTSRSGGKGGQNVNKVETKVEVSLNVKNSFALSKSQKERILEKLTNRISEEGLLKLTEEKHRSQLANKEAVVEKLVELLNRALKVQKARKKTKPSKSSKLKRRESKEKRSELKKTRKRLF